MGMPLPPLRTRAQARSSNTPKSCHFILFAEGRERDSPMIQKLIRDQGAVSLEITGWCHEDSYQDTHPADAYFTLSDHSTFNQLAAYLQSCAAEQIYLIDSPTPELTPRLQPIGLKVEEIQESPANVMKKKE